MSERVAVALEALRARALELEAVVRGITDADWRRETEAERWPVSLELPRIGWVAFVVWDPELPLTRAQRNQVVAHIRYVADFMVSPWNRWRNHGDRRAAVYLYFRRLAGVSLDIRGRVAHLRSTMPELFGSETTPQTKMRLYRISAALDEVRPPRLTQRIARAQAAADGQRVSTCRRFDRRTRRRNTGHISP